MNNSNDMKQATRELMNLMHQMADEASKLGARVDAGLALDAANLLSLGEEYEALSGYLSDAVLSMSAIRALVETRPGSPCPGDYAPHERLGLTLAKARCGLCGKPVADHALSTTEKLDQSQWEKAYPDHPWTKTLERTRARALALSSTKRSVKRSCAW